MSAASELVCMIWSCALNWSARHTRAAAYLQGLSSVYVDLLAERILDAPATVSCFTALCQALGE